MRGRKDPAEAEPAEHAESAESADAPGIDDLGAPDAGTPVAGRIRRIAESAAWRLSATAVASVVVFAAVYVVFVLSEQGRRLEDTALMGAQLRGAAVREESLAFLSQLTVLSYALAILGLVAVAFIRRRPGLGVLVAGVMGGATVVAEVLKDVLPRPETIAGPAWILRNDFPSGTATVAASLGIGALLVAPDRLRWVVLPLGAIFAAVIGQSTQITGWHRMSAAIGGVLLVIAAASAALLLLARIGLVHRSPWGRVHPRIHLALLVVPAAAFLIATSALLLLVAFPLLQTPRDAESVFLHTVSELFGFGFTIVAFVAFASVIEPFSFGRSAARNLP